MFYRPLANIGNVTVRRVAAGFLLLLLPVIIAASFLFGTVMHVIDFIRTYVTDLYHLVRYTIGDAFRILWGVARTGDFT